MRIAGRKVELVSLTENWRRFLFRGMSGSRIS